MRFSEDTPKTEEKLEDKDRIIFAPPEPKLRTVGVMGEINDDAGAEVVLACSPYKTRQFTMSQLTLKMKTRK